jgi:EcsC protein family
MLIAQGASDSRRDNPYQEVDYRERVMSLELTKYEHEALEAIVKWRAQPPGRVATYLGKATQVIEKPTELLMDTAVGKVVKGIVEIAMDAGSWTVDEDRVVEAFAKRGVEVNSFDDIRTSVKLKDKDRMAARIAKGYRWGMGAEGAAAGAGSMGGPAVGAAALAADITALTTVACRAAAHHAAVYGYRVETPAERALALAVLNGATSPTDLAKQTALANITKISADIAKKKTWEKLESYALVKVIQEAAEKLGINLTKAKLAQVVAVIGIAIGGGYNAWYMSRVCEWSYWIYREHALQDKQAGFPDLDDDAPTELHPAEEPPFVVELSDADVVDEPPASRSSPAPHSAPAPSSTGR